MLAGGARIKLKRLCRRVKTGSAHKATIRNLDGMGSGIRQLEQNVQAPSYADTLLLSLGAEGNREAFDSLAQRHGPAIRAFLRARYRKFDDHTLDDLLSEIFLRLWQRRSSVRTIRNLPAYLTVMARHAAADHIDASFAQSPPDEGTISAAPSPLAMLERQELAQAIEHALEQLSRSQRQALLLTQDGLTARQIAAVAGTSEKAVHRRVAEAHGKLRAALSPCGRHCGKERQLPAPCPAEAENSFCLKRIYERYLRATREK